MERLGAHQEVVFGPLDDAVECVSHIGVMDSLLRRRAALDRLKRLVRALRFAPRDRGLFRADELASSRPYHGCDHEPLCEIEPLTAVGFIEQQGCVNVGEHAVLISFKRKKLSLGLDAAIFERNRSKAFSSLHD